MISFKGLFISIILFLLFTLPALANDQIQGMLKSKNFLALVKENPILSDYANIDYIELYKKLDSLQYSEYAVAKLNSDFSDLQLVEQAQLMGYKGAYEQVLDGKKSAEQLSTLIKSHYKYKIYSHNEYVKRFKQHILNNTESLYNDSLVKYLIERLPLIEDSSEKSRIRRFLFLCLLNNPEQISHLKNSEFKDNNDLRKVLDNIEKFNKGLLKELGIDY